MDDREPRRERQPATGSTLGKRGAFDQERGDGRGANGGLHFRMLVQLKKAGSVIGKGGDFIQMTKSMTGAKVAVDKPVGTFDERLVHVEGADEPGKPIAGIQEAVLRAAERIMGEEGSGGQVKLPHKCQLRMLLFKYQIGAVMGKKGATINEIRNKSGASVKLTTPQGMGPIVPCALRDDELITIVGTPEATLTALKMISDKLRAAMSHAQDRAATDRPDNKRSRPEASRAEPGGPPQHWDGPGSLPPGHPGLAGPPPGGPPPGNAIAMALPPAARGILANNDSVKTEGLVGPFTVEYRVLVPVRKSGVILGGKGGVIKEIRSRTGAKVHFYDEEKGAQDRILQVMSTEDVQDHHCAAFDATMDFVQALVQDEKEPTVSVRIILPHGQVGAVMGKAGSTIKELRSVSGCQIQLTGHPDVPKCVKKGEEVLEMRGPRDSVLLATHIALVAIRGNMARGQLIYNYPAPHGAPLQRCVAHLPWTRPPPPFGGPPPGAPPSGFGAPPSGYRGPPPGAPPPAGLAPYAGGPPPDPRLQHPQQGAPPMHLPAPLPRGRSRWDSDAPPAIQQEQPLPQHAQPQQLPAPPVYAESLAPAPQYAPAPAPQQQHIQQGAPVPQHLQPAQQQVPGAAPPQPQQVQYVQGPPPSAGVQTVYSTAPPPAGFVPAPQQQVVYTGPDGQTYVQQQAAPPLPQQPQQQQPPQQVPAQIVQPQAPAPASQPMLMYTSPDGQTQYVQQLPAQQIMQQPAAAPSQPPVTYVYAPTAAPVAAAAPAAANNSGPASSSGYGGLTGLVSTVAPAPVAATPPPVPKARVLLTQDQVNRLRLEDKNQCVQLGALSGATITLSDHVLENGAREVLLAGTDAQCNTAKNLMEALMRSG